jgi:hypothetical protein
MATDNIIPQDILGFRTVTSMLAVLGPPKMEIDDHRETEDIPTLPILNALATLLVRQHEVVAVVVDERSIPDNVNVIVCLESRDTTLTASSQYVLPDSHIATANPRQPKSNSLVQDRDSLTYIGNEPKLHKVTEVDIQLSDPWPHIRETW